MAVGWVLLACGVLACGGSASPPKSSDDTEAPAPPAGEAREENGAPAGEEAAAAPAPPAPPAPALPETCAEGSDECLPPDAWVKKLCDGVYAEVALYMFRGGTPWQRLYLRGKTRAVNASGGASVEGHLLRDEEVLVLRHRKDDAGGMQIGDGSGQYDVLRWNGSCASLEGGEVTSRRPRAPIQARIEWSWLGDAMRTALRTDAAVNEAFLARKKECRGVTTGAVSKACEKLDGKLIERIAAYVRSGAELPAPEQKP